MHFFLLLTPFIIILGAAVFAATIFGFVIGLIAYVFTNDIEKLKAYWIIFTFIAVVGMLVYFL